MNIGIVVLILVVVAILGDILRITIQRYRWHRGKGPNDREIANALVCMSAYMRAMQREMKATTVKSITIHADGEYDVATLPTLHIAVQQPIDTKPNKR